MAGFDMDIRKLRCLPGCGCYLAENFSLPGGRRTAVAL